MRIHGPALAEIRERSGYNASEFAREVGISPQYLSDIESGRRPGSPKVIKAIADTLRCRVVAILEPECDEKAAS